MKIGLIGAGNMGSALARGLGEPLLVHDVDSARATALAEAIGGQAVAGAGDLGGSVDLVILAHKPAQLEEVAAALGPEPVAVASILGGVATDALGSAYPNSAIYRFMPNIPAEVGRGLLCYAPGPRAGDGPESDVLDLFGRAGAVIRVPEELMEPATALVGCAPAFYALVAEALADAGSRRGIAPDLAAEMAAGAMAGTAAVLEATANDAPELRRRVTSPGGLTERGLAALERHGIRAAFDAAVAAVVGDESRR